MLFFLLQYAYDYICDCSAKGFGWHHTGCISHAKFATIGCNPLASGVHHGRQQIRQSLSRTTPLTQMTWSLPRFAWFPQSAICIPLQTRPRATSASRASFSQYVLGIRLGTHTGRLICARRTTWYPYRPIVHGATALAQGQMAWLD